MKIKGQDLGSYQPVSDELVLAAVQRRHETKVRHYHVAEHLGFVHNGATSRGLRPQLEALKAEGSLRTTREQGKDVFALTRRGSGRLGAARRAGKVDPVGCVNPIVRRKTRSDPTGGFLGPW